MDWVKYYLSVIEKDEWSVIKIGCFQDTINAFVNGEQVINEYYSGDPMNLIHEWGLGFDKNNIPDILLVK